MNDALEITTFLAPVGPPCPNACTLCPQSVLARAYPADSNRVLTLEGLQKALATVPKSVDIHFSGYAEPFFNQEAAQMIGWCQAQGWPVHLFTTLVGLTRTGCTHIMHDFPHSLKSVTIHVPDQRAFQSNEDTWIIRHDMWRELGIFTRYMAMGPLSTKLSTYLNRLSLTVDLPQMRSRAGNLWPVERIDGPIYCGDNRYHRNVMVPNGDVHLCCETYALDAKLGNLFEETYATIWVRAEQFRENNNPPENSPCRTCEHGIRV